MASHSDFPPFAELSLNDSRQSNSRCPTPHLQSNLDPTVFSFRPFTTIEPKNLSSPLYHLSQWSVPGWQSSLDFESDIIPPYSNTENTPPSWGTQYYPKATMESLFLPRLSLPDLSDCGFESLSAILRAYCLTSAVCSPLVAYRYVFVRLFGCFILIPAVIYPCHLQYSCCRPSTTPLSLTNISSIRFARCGCRSLPSTVHKGSTQAKAGGRR